ncbi:hypothetical protein Tco_0403007, partial [Tanacetum coccineum]
MSTTSEDIQAASSDTRPPMLDRTNYESWAQDTISVTPEEGVILGPERPKTYADLNETERERYNAHFHASNFVLQGLSKNFSMANLSSAGP